MGVREMDGVLEQWEVGVKDMHRRLILAPTPRERALRQAQGLARRLVAGPRLDRLGHERDPHTIGRWASAFGEGGLQP